MSKEEEQIFIGIVGGSMIILMLGIFLLLFLLVYQRRHNAHIREKLDMRRDFEENLTQTQFEVREQTRRNLAEELHDNIGQILSLTNVTLASIDLADAERATSKITDAQSLVRRSISELRRLAKVLHGQQLIEEGLIESIRRDVEWLDSKGFYKIQLDIQSNGQEFGRGELNLIVYRLFQESISNIVKHSQADTICIFLSFLDPMMYLTISDNGNGFDQVAATGSRGGLGLTTMRRRVELLGGNMELSTAMGEGTILTFKIPYLSFEPAN